MPTANASFRTEPDTLAALDHIAQTMGRSRNWAVNQALKNFIEYNQWYLEQVEEGVKAADAGDFADPVEVEAIFRKHGA